MAGAMGPVDHNTYGTSSNGRHQQKVKRTNAPVSKVKTSTAKAPGFKGYK